MNPAAVLTGPRVVLQPQPAEAAFWQTDAETPAHAWTITVRGVPIGSTILRVTREDRTWATYGIAIDRTQRRGRGYGTEATRLVRDYAFGVLGLAAVQLTVATTNLRAIACYRRCGFTLHIMGRRGGRNHYGMLCANPARFLVPNTSLLPTLILLDATRRRITLRQAEAAFLGVGPGDQVSIGVDPDGSAVVTPVVRAA